MKKVLIIGPFPYERIKTGEGGVELYIRTILSIKDKDITFDYIPIDNIHKINNKKDFIKYYSHSGMVNNIKGFDDYDVIINNTPSYLDKIHNYKTVWVQHGNPKIYSKNRKIKAFLINFFKINDWRNWIYRFFSLFVKPYPKYVKNIACFNKYHEKYLGNKKCNFFNTLIPINLKFNSIEFCKKTNQIAFVGRLSQGGKNIELLQKIAISNNYLYQIFGSGNDKYMLSCKRFIFNGFIERDSLLQNNELINCKIAVFTSIYEGACIALHDVLSIGIVPLCNDFGAEIDAVIPKELHKYLVIKKTNDINEWNEKINYLMSLNENDYLLLHKRILEHYKKTYGTKSSFKDQWRQLIRSF